MQTIINPHPTTWPELQRRPQNRQTDLFKYVEPILSDIKKRGDAALREYTIRFDGYAPEAIRVSDYDIITAEHKISEQLKQAIKVAHANIERFHSAQKEPERVVETMPGVICRQKSVPIQKVGLYIPGGSAPLFSTVLMLAVPAKIAECKEIILCTPPGKDGSVHPAILYTASLVGVTAIYRIGGIQAIGAMTYGTETISAVDKIFGPGNQYVMAAKQMVSLSDVAIDMPAGPSEVLVMADESANPSFVAADLLSQAEHGADSQVIMLTTSEIMMKQVEQALEHQLKELPRSETAHKALENSRMILLSTTNEMLEFSNQYAPEHLILSVNNAAEIAEMVTCAGSVFLGNYTPESAGDYASGTNHTLPTHGYARAYSGVNLDSFMKKITFQTIDPKALTVIGPVIETLAEAEELQAHKNAVSIRLKQLSNSI